MGKIKTLEEYLAENNFLREAAEFHFKLEKNLTEVEPLELPPREKVLELVRAEKIPLLQQEKFQAQVLDAVEKFLPRDLAESLLRQENLSAKKICAAHELNETLTRKTFWATVDKLIPADLKLWERDDWQENYCPICGRRPVMAQLKKFNDGRERRLLCGGCRTLWSWRRVGCPYCGNENLERIHILELDKKMRLDVCDECRAYLKTYTDEDEENIYLRDWATLHLDLLAEEKTLHKCGAVELE
ncbi:MAG: formate dehydrogenase accessory protein FdhE [Quinella sp. 3Q1]|nr:formate dehydrogenase accessory protein FdhE [Quinella sp. 3Q1]MBR6887842.1 formate dehydrogenase accessory protein FdhE [Selenomonadaceae bacterium]